jgi:ribosome-binding protein aMBF1 (putative translation factor)
MISNEREYQITKEEAERFERAIQAGDRQGTDLDPLIRQAMREAMESQLEELREELVEYDALRYGHIAVLELDALDKLPEALIRARIAAGLTQKQLAQRLGMKEQQIQRYEARRYAGASLARVQAVAEALGVKIRQQVVLPTVGERRG